MRSVDYATALVKTGKGEFGFCVHLAHLKKKEKKKGFVINLETDILSCERGQVTA